MRPPVHEPFAVDVPHLHLAPAPGVGDVEPVVAGREAESVRRADLVGDPGDRAGRAVDAVDRQRQLLLGRMAFVTAADAVRRVGEPDAAVGVDDDIVRRVQTPALETVRDDRHRAGVLVARHAPAAVLAGDLTPRVVERVAVAVAGRAAEDADVAVLLQPAHLAVVRDVAPDQIASAAVPGRPFRPQRAGVVPADRRVEEDVGPEPRVERDDVRIRVVERGSSRPVARFVRRQAPLPRGGQRRRDRRGGDRGAEERAPAQRPAGRAEGAGRRRAGGVGAHVQIHVPGGAGTPPPGGDGRDGRRRRCPYVAVGAGSSSTAYRASSARAPRMMFSSP